MTRLPALFLSLIIVPVQFAFAAMVGKEVSYEQGGTVFKGYYVYDDATAGRRPGVLVVHEWWGHNAYTRQRAEQLAKLGYAALAVDMYGDGKTADHPSDAGKFSSMVMSNLDNARARFDAARSFLNQQAQVDPSKNAAIGYCFGGAVVLNMARMGSDLAGVASFHGSLSTSKPATKGGVKSKVLVCHGGDDQFIPPEVVDSFKAEMKTAGVDLRFHSYEGAKHGFTNPEVDAKAAQFNLPLKYDAKADAASWKELEGFLLELFPR